MEVNMKQESFDEFSESHKGMIEYLDIQDKREKSENIQRNDKYKTRPRNRSKVEKSPSSTLKNEDNTPFSTLLNGNIPQSSTLKKRVTTRNSHTKVDLIIANNPIDKNSKIYFDDQVCLNEKNIESENQAMLHESIESKDSLQILQGDTRDVIDDVTFEDFLIEDKSNRNVCEEDTVFCKCGRKGYSKMWYTKHTKKCEIFRFYKNKGVILYTSCGLCEFTAGDVDSLRKHMDEHFARNDVDCQLCDFSGRDFAEMVHHRFSHTDERSKMYCHICRKTFWDPKKLEFHFRSFHMKKKGGLCRYCGEEVNSYKGWKRHELRLHSRDKYGEQKDIFICDCCGLRFLYRNNIIQHLLERNGLTTCVCDTCGASFKRPSNLRSHISNVHTDHEMVQCPHCPRLIKKHGLKRHVTVNHGEKKYVCELCSTSFTTNSSLKYHMMGHTNSRPYQCDLCSKRYKLKQVLKNHILTKHTGLKPHQCNDCRKAFGTSVLLRRHAMVVHLKKKHFQCGQCDKSFFYKYVLRKHEERVHLGVPRYGSKVMLS